MPLAVLHSPEEWVARFGDRRLRATLTVGNFDGLHLGHRRILRGVVERARVTDTLATAVTFHPHPLRILRPAEAPPLLSTLAQRLAGLEALGLDAVLVLKFDHALSLLRPEEFVREILVEQLRLSAILVGENFRFGHKHAGDLRLLAQLGRELDFDVASVPPVLVRGAVVSSTAIRAAVAEGRVARAARLLGHAFVLGGTVRAGTGQGARFVFPTLNLAPEQELLPAKGVYVTETWVEGAWHRSATNVGVRPTFDGGPLSVESHLLDFSKRITAGRMEIRFWERLRAEIKFSGPDALRARITKDLERTRSFFSRLGRSQRKPSQRG